MANVYVRSGAAGAGTGADWANAYTTLSAALTAKAAGDSYWVSEDHAESTAGAVTLTAKGTATTPSLIYCVNHLGSVPPVSADLRTTATIATTGANSLTCAGSFYCYGISFSAGDAANTANIQLVNTNGAIEVFERCSFTLGNTSASSILYAVLNSNGNSGKWVNCTCQFGSTSQKIGLRSSFVWKNTASAIVGATIPTSLFFPEAGFAASILLEGVDLSALGSGKTIFDTSGLTTVGQFFLKDCKLGASVTVSGVPGGLGFSGVFSTRSDSGATNYRSEKYHYLGTETTETTIVRTGGASDGATPQSRKLATTANSKWVLPFEALPIVFWNAKVGVSVTLTLEGTWNQAAVPNNDDIWMECEYLGTAATPLGSYANDTKADNLAAGAALSASIAAWAGGGSGAGWSPFKMSVTFTPQMAGPVTVYVKAANPSKTFYVDPLLIAA